MWALHALAFSPDGQLLAVGNRAMADPSRGELPYGTIQLPRVQDGTVVRMWRTEPACWGGIAFSPDAGLAPNPFHGWCTLALCTPNHVGARLGPGDFIAGVSRSGGPPRLVFTMEVAERLDLDEYYRDPRFAPKKPNRHGPWKERVGDNLYFRAASGEWQQDVQTLYHREESEMARDLRRPKAFVGRRFACFGEKAGSDVDLMVIGEVGLREISRRLGGIGGRIGREVNSHAMTPAEFSRRRTEREHFVTAVMAAEKLFVVGGADELAAVGQ